MVAPSFLLLIEHQKLIAVSSDLNVTLGLAGSVALIAIVTHVAFLSPHLKALVSVAEPFLASVRPQVSCAIGAVVYALFVGCRTRQFRR